MKLTNKIASDEVLELRGPKQQYLSHILSLFLGISKIGSRTKFHANIEGNSPTLTIRLLSGP
jgi:hypothetical protein